MERGSRGRNRRGAGVAVGAVTGERNLSGTEVQLFRDDVVQSVAQPSMVGLVLRVGGESDSDTESSDSDSESSDSDFESSDSEESLNSDSQSSNSEESDEDEVAEGAARVCWINSEESTEKVGDLKVIDRAFLHGDIVAKAIEPRGHTGTVVDVEIMVDLELPNGDIMKDVNSMRLRRERAFDLDDYVIHDTWLGHVEEVVDNVTVLFDDGSKCKVMRANPVQLRPMNEPVIDDLGSPFFQGQKVCTNSASIFKYGKWLKGSFKASSTKGTIIEVEAGTAIVDWIAERTALSAGCSHQTPSDEMNARKLLPIINFSHTNWQLGDRSLPPTAMQPSIAVPTEGCQMDGNPSGGELEDLFDGTDNAPRSSDSVDPTSCGNRESCSSSNGEGRACILHPKKGKQLRRQAKRENKMQSNVFPPEGSQVDRIPSDADAEASFDSTGNGPQRLDCVNTVSCDTGESCSSSNGRGEACTLHPQEGKQQRRQGKREKKMQSNVVPTQGSQVDRIPFVDNAETSFDSTGSVPRRSDCVDSKSCGTGESCSSKGGSKARTLHRRKGSQQRQQPKREKEMQNKEKEKPVEYALLVKNTRTTVDVVWQDGTLSHGVDACALVPVNHIGDHEFWPEQYVLERGSDGEGFDDGPRRVGIVKVVDAKQRMASVRWLKHVNQPDESREFEPEELMSLYELVEHPDYDYCLGDVVIRIIAAPSTSEDSPGAEDRVLPRLVRVDTPEAEPEDNDKGEAPRRKARESTAQRKIDKIQSNPQSQDLSWVGVITGLQDGDIEVAWADGMVSKVGPEAIRVVDLDSGGDSHSAQSNDLKDAEDFNDAASSKTVDCDNDNGRRNQDLPGGGSPLGPDNYSCRKNEEDLGGQSHSDGSGARDDEETVEKDCAEIKKFDCVKDPSDHHFFRETGQPTNLQKWVKKIQQEWAMLEKNLPDTIFVRVFEERMDLLRAVIIGAKQTPYHDGLFVFDVYMRPDYPTVLPLFYYHSGGLRMNPNLYENGMVCLSLLDTWSGKGSEIWHPSTSSILQVLVSIQGLVLNEKPYFNEAGYDKQVGTGEGEKNSALYNENSFLLSCKSMLYLLRRPPMQLEDLIRDHFQKVGPHVLLACKAYLAGAEVGSLTESDLSDVEERKFGDHSSAGFKIMLRKLVPKLAAAFEEAGAKSS